MDINPEDYRKPVNEFTLPGNLAHVGCGEVCVSYAAQCHGHAVTPEEVSSHIFGDGVQGFTDTLQLSNAYRVLAGSNAPVSSPPYESGDIVACYCLPDGTIVPRSSGGVGHWVLVLDTDGANVMIANPAGGTVQLIPYSLLVASYQGGLSIVRTGTLLPACLASSTSPDQTPTQGEPDMALLDERDQLNAYFQLVYNIISTFRDHKLAIPSDAAVQAFITEAEATGSVAAAIAHTFEAQK